MTLTLNPEQKQCVEFGEGPVQIIAGAGSGKTRVLTERIISLIERGVPANRILAMAFNKKAQLEMVERVALRMGEERAKEVWIRTFHSLGYQIAQENGHMFGYRGRMGVLSGGRQQMFLEMCLQDANLEPEEFMGLLIQSIRESRSNDMTATEWVTHVKAAEMGRNMVEVAHAVRGYETKKRIESVIDFDDMIFMARRALKSDQNVLARWQAMFRYVLVDEFQDVDDAQMDIVRMLAAPENNLTVVGDPDQSIYSFRGANPSFTINFRDYYPDATVIFLNRNYRSTKPIIEHSNKLIQVNENRVPKELLTEVESDDNPGAFLFMDATSEAGWVAADIRRHVDAGGNPGDIACIYRTNAQAAFLEAAIMQQGIPYVVMGGFSFYNRKEVQDIIAYISLAATGDNASFERIYNRPNRYLGKAFIEDMKKLAKVEKKTYWEIAQNIGLYTYKGAFRTRGVQRNVDSLVNVVRLIQHSISRSANAGDVVQSVVKHTAYDEYLKKDVEDNTEDNDVMANVKSLTEVATEFIDIEKFIEFIRGMQAAKTTEDNAEASRMVKLMTIHKSKGLEFPTVYVTGVAKNLLPHAMAEEVEEERRLCYVAMTRAKQSLRVTSFQSYNGKTTGLSQFIKEAGLDVEDKTDEG